VLEVCRLSDAKEYLLKHSVVLFDLDDTLYSEKDYVKSGFNAIARHFKDVDRLDEKLWSAFENGEKAIDFVLQTEGSLSTATKLECLNIYRSHEPEIVLSPDAKELLPELKKKGVWLGLITDGRPDGQRAKIKALNLELFFDKIIITDELGGIDFRKPNPRAFEEMQQFFRVPYNEMVYVGDNVQKDFISPQRLGMKSVYFKNQFGLYFR
jgi:putative hydrolase of the HAD superfamily